MMLIQDFAAYRQRAHEPAAVTIGNFDGCHLGHQALLQAAIDQADNSGGPAVGVTFAPRSDAFFRGVTNETLLFSPDQKTRALMEAGLDVEILKTFDVAFSRVTADEFYEGCLRRDLNARAIIVGHNFRFGHERGGDTAYLVKRGAEDGLEVIIGQAVEYLGQPISSTRIREALGVGDMTAVTEMLGRPYLLEGVIARGDQLGRQLGVPTANLEGLDQLVPRYGIYAGYVWLCEDDDEYPSILGMDPSAIPAVFSFGVRPTLNQVVPPVRVEAHLLRGIYGPDALYGKRAGYYVTHRLRDEERFDDLDALKDQMGRDIDAARRLLKS